MQWLLSIFLIFFALNGEAQKKSKVDIHEMDQDQLSLALTRSKKTIKTGKILTFVGMGTAAIGTTMLISGVAKLPTDDSSGSLTEAGAFVMLFGGIALWTGIPVWIVGASKKRNIELELVKFNQKGSESVNGIGLKIRF
jgi:hypothetical protein